MPNGSSPAANRSWAALVAEGRQLAASLSKHQWRLGDLALEVEPLGAQGGTPTGAGGRLGRFAERIGVEHNSLIEYRLVSAKWPINNRRLVFSWSVHQALAAQADRFALISSRKKWTVREARDLAAKRRQHRAPSEPRQVPLTGVAKDLSHVAATRWEPDAAACQCPRWNDVDRVLRRELAEEHPDALRLVRPGLLELFLGGAA